MKNWRKEGTTSSHHGPYRVGYKHTTMVDNRGLQCRKAELIPKNHPSSDWSLQLETMKSESLVISRSANGGESVPGSCTHCPSRHGSWSCPKRSWSMQIDGASKVGLTIMVKS